MCLCFRYWFCLEGIDIDAATENGIKVARIPGDVTGNAASCAEMAIYLMLGLLRKQVIQFPKNPRFLFTNFFKACTILIFETLVNFVYCKNGFIIYGFIHPMFERRVIQVQYL